MPVRAYPKYKPSGVEWLGEVPEHWEVKRLKTSAPYWVSNVDKVASDDELPVRLCNYTDVYNNDYIHPNMDLMQTTATADEIRRFGLHVNDVVITKDSEEWNDIAVPALVIESAPDLVCGYHLAIIRANQQVLLGRFLFRSFQSYAINQQFQIAASGVTRYGLPKSSIGEALILLPPLSEQRAIADYLDRETVKLDTLVAKKQELIEKLKEKRTALISRAVTRGLPPDAARAAGLDPHPKLKSSGIEWLGEVPEHWEVTVLRRVALRIKTGSTPPTAEEHYYENGSVPWFGPSSFDDQITLSKPVKSINESAIHDGVARLFKEGATMIVGIGATVGKVSSLTKASSCNQQITVIEFDVNRVFSRFGTYQFKRLEPTLREIAPSATLPILVQSDIANIHLALPSMAEQRAITDYLDRETAKIDQMAAKVGEAIARLQEYRTALITAVVTGKIEVRKEPSEVGLAH